MNNTTDPTKNISGVAIANQERERARNGGYMIIAVGALIAFAAIAIDCSVKRTR